MKGKLKAESQDYLPIFITCNCLWFRNWFKQDSVLCSAIITTMIT